MRGFERADLRIPQFSRMLIVHMFGHCVDLGCESINRATAWSAFALWVELELQLCWI